MRKRGNAAWRVWRTLAMASLGFYAAGCATKAMAPFPSDSAATVREPLIPAVAIALAPGAQSATYSKELIIDNGRNPGSANYVHMRVPLDMPLGSMLFRELTLWASNTHIPLSASDEADVLATINKVEVTSVNGKLPPPTFRVRLECTIVFTDKNGKLLNTICLRGNGTHETIVSPLLSATGSLVKLLLSPESTAEPYGHAAFEKALSEVVEALFDILSDKASVESMLIADALRAPAHVLTLRGATCLEEGSFLRAYLYCRRATERFPKYQPAACYLGAALAQLGEHEKAKATLRKAIALNPQTEEAIAASNWLETLEAAGVNKSSAD